MTRFSHNIGPCTAYINRMCRSHSLWHSPNGDSKKICCLKEMGFVQDCLKNYFQRLSQQLQIKLSNHHSAWSIRPLTLILKIRSSVACLISSHRIKQSFKIKWHSKDWVSGKSCFSEVRGCNDEIDLGNQKLVTWHLKIRIG